ncbi:hypothetical protein GGP51_003224 [Salinibacter ruber]|uniref:asparagine synthase-related protein n=1 Tax=Salinibacter ruber TaxID=146919 RepID=UPI002167C532|nr:asparagine synthase-related protein [Salinibacter ruber]MCS4191727.1 hypothetical protein [Salinibacter ruber]
MDWVVSQSERSLSLEKYEVHRTKGGTLRYTSSRNLQVLERRNEPFGVASGQLFGPLADPDNLSGQKDAEGLGDLALKSEGSFSVAILHDEKITLVTDAGGSIPVFYGRGPEGFAVGTLVHHVATLSGLDDIDKVSVADYLLNGTICYPYSWYERVQEAQAGSVISFDHEGIAEHHTYWQPTEPDNVREDCNSEKWGKHLNEQIKEAVRLGVEGKSKGRVLYSGGVDSRAVLSLVPSSFECIPTTVTDFKNQEYRVAKRSARLLGRELDRIRRPEDHYRSSIRELIDTIGPGWDFTHAHISRQVGDQFKDADVILGGYLADTFFKTLWMPDVRSGRFRPDRLLPALPNTVTGIDLDKMSDLSLWSNLIGRVLERRKDHHERLKKLRPKTAGSWHQKFPLSNQPHFAHYLAPLRVGPSMIEPFAFSGTYRLAAKMPDTARVDMRAFRHAFASEMGLAGWWPTSSGEICTLEDKYFGHMAQAISHRWLRFRRNLNPFPVEGAWSPDAAGWSPVHPERHFSDSECQALERHLDDLFAGGIGADVFENEDVSDEMKVRALTLAFDTPG